MRSLCLLALCVGLASVEGAQPGPLVELNPLRVVTVQGPTKAKPYTLIRHKAEGVDPKAGIVWRVHPPANVQKATSPRGVLEWVAPPGNYRVELLAITVGPDGAVSVDEQATDVEIESPGKTAPEQPQPPKSGKLDPVNALGRIQFGNAGCTATVIGPRRSDGKWDVLSAAHCVSREGQRGTMKLKDGRTLNLTVVSIDRGPDCSWHVTDETFEDLAFAHIAERNPEPDVKIWHMGYGVDRPGNREDGEVLEGENGEGQIRMLLSVSSGDSGGGIFRNDTGELVSVVCCTARKGAKVNVWGCSAEQAAKRRPKSVSAEAWTPLPIPERPDPTAGEWVPMEVPIRP